MANRGVVGEWRMYPDILDEVEEGDVIEFYRSRYCHFGVYVGRQGSVHYIIHKVNDSGDSSSSGSSGSSSSIVWFYSSSSTKKPNQKPKGVLQDGFEGVCAGKKCRINNEVDNDPKSGGPYGKAQIVDRCMGKLDNCTFNLKYDNCEHFANWCRTGYSISYQALNASWVSSMYLASAGSSG